MLGLRAEFCSNTAESLNSARPATEPCSNQKLSTDLTFLVHFFCEKRVLRVEVSSEGCEFLPSIRK